MTDAARDFTSILRQTQSHIRAYIAGMGIAAHEVDDLAQDVYIELYRNFDRIPPGVAPERWLKGIARNLCLNHIRVSSRRGRLLREAVAELLTRTPSIDEPPEGHPLAAALRSCLEKLPEPSRKFIALRYEQDLSPAEIARRTNRTAEVVRVALFRVRLLLKECLSAAVARET